MHALLRAGIGQLTTMGKDTKAKPGLQTNARVVACHEKDGYHNSGREDSQKGTLCRVALQHRRQNNSAAQYLLRLTVKNLMLFRLFPMPSGLSTDKKKKQKKEEDKRVPQLC
jgi:hypothetical protein